MNRFVPYLGVIVAIFVGTLAVASLGSATVERTPSSIAPRAPVATSSPAPIKKVKPPSPTSKATESTAALPVSTVSISPMPSSAELDSSAAELRAALVNIVCYALAGSGLQSILGSGVFIDAKGIILTNAHVAQYFLLADRGASCVIHSGSPASDRYDASLIYISPLWLRTNASVLVQANPSGTGEYDFALLVVTKSANRDALPSQFPSIPLATHPPLARTPIIIASYGAQFLASSQIQSDLFPTIVFGSVKDVFTFASTTIDVLALGGSVAAQEGSSGGGVANGKGELVGTITTSTVECDTSTRELNAITASYIRAEYASETGSPLDLLFTQPTAQSVSIFAPQMPSLESILTAHLQ